MEDIDLPDLGEVLLVEAMNELRVQHVEREVAAGRVATEAKEINNIVDFVTDSVENYFKDLVLNEDIQDEEETERGRR